MIQDVSSNMGSARYSCLFLTWILAGVLLATRAFAVETTSPKIDSPPGPDKFEPKPLDFKINVRGSGERLESSSEPADESYSLLFGQARGSLVLTRFLSLHGDAKAYRIFYRKEGSSEYTRDSRETDSLLVQLGNPAFHPIRMIGGKGSVPFGVNHQVLMESLALTLSPRLNPPHAVYGSLILDDQVDQTFEGGMFGENAPPLQKRNDEEAEKRETGSDGGFIRLSKDFPELYATRASLSFRGTRAGARAAGFGLVNENAKGETTALEYVRSRTTTNPGDDADEVSVRVTHIGTFVQDARLIAFIEDLSSLYRTGIVQGDWQLGTHAMLRVGIGYLKSENESVDSRWFICGGMEVGL